MLKKNNISLREINKKNIFKIIFKSGPISRIGISKMLKISRPTVTNYINELIEEGLIAEIGKSKSTALGGKRAVLVDLNGKAFFIIGVMIGMRSIKFSLSDFRLNILFQFEVETEEWKGSKSVIKKIIDNVNKIINDKQVIKENVIGIGIGASGLVDSKNGKVIFSPNLEGWKNIELKNIIESSTNIPTFIENDIRVKTIAEKNFGLAKDIENFLCIEVSEGVGTGVFINNKLHVGTMGMAGEVGHIMTSISNEKVCHCGNVGCLETICSIRALIEEIAEDIKDNNEEGKYYKSELLEENIYKLYKENDEIVNKNVEKNAKLLGIGISNSIKMFSPELVIIHGDVIKFGESYLKIVKESVKENTFPKVKKDYDIQLSKLGEEAGLLGVSYVVLKNIFNLEDSSISSQYIIKNV